MDASFTVVIKVKYGDVLRRFNAPVIHEKLFLDMYGLREKILSLFSFAPDTDLVLTYVDEDGDVVALVDDDDLRDVVKQGLNPIRLTVNVNADKKDNENYSNASLTPFGSPHVQDLPNWTADVSEILSRVSEPLRGTLLKLCDDWATKASLSSPSMDELVDNLSKLSSSILGQQLSQSGETLNRQNGVPENSSATHNKPSKTLRADPATKLENLKPTAIDDIKDAKTQNVTWQKEGPSFDFNAVAEALESQNLNISSSESLGVSHTVCRKEKAKKTIDCSNGKSDVGKVAEFCVAPSNLEDNMHSGNDIHNSPLEPELGLDWGTDGSSHLMNEDHVIDWTASSRHIVSEDAPVPSWSLFNGCSHFGTVRDPSTMENISDPPPHCVSDAVPFRRSNSQNESTGSIFHHAVCCHGCGIDPIVGPRFKSKVKLNYVLCRACFEKKGNVNDYIGTDRPTVYNRHHLPHFRAREKGAMFPHVYRSCKGKLGSVKLESRFIQDVNISDGTIMAPLTPFTKIWRMRNNGTASWPEKTQLVWIGGDTLTNLHSVEVQIPAGGLLMGQELDVAVNFLSPELPGRYISYWRMASPSGSKFGQHVWVLIEVDASIDGNLNLNLPPASSSLTGSESVSVDPAPEVEARYPKAGNSKTVVELELTDSGSELKFPLDDSFFIGNEAGSSSAAPSSSSVTYPIIDLTDLIPTLPSVYPSMLSSIPPPPPIAPEVAADPAENGSIDDRLIRLQERMALKQAQRNNEVLKRKAYALEKAVADLCDVAEWDPILAELQEMGFVDTELNKLLLKKNKGSITRVVMDLLHAEVQ